MPPLLSSLSSSSANTTRPTQLQNSTNPSRTRSRRSLGWLAWVPRSLPRRGPRSKGSQPSGYDGDYDDSGRHERAGIDGAQGVFRTSRSRTRRQKSVTLEGPSGAPFGLLGSDEGTVRRSARLGGLRSSQEDGSRDVKLSRLADGTTRHPSGDRTRLFNDDQTDAELQRIQYIRPVSREDHLIVRGANPRTGIVSPSPTNSARSSTEEERRNDQVHIQRPQKWRLKGDQWISMDASDKTPFPSPHDDLRPRPSAQDHAQAYIDLLSKSGVPLTKWEDKFVVDMPSARDPSPPTMTTQQIHELQRAIERLRRHGGHPVHPDTPPTPRVVTPEGPSTPPTKLSKIYRLKHRNEAAGTSAHPSQRQLRRLREQRDPDHVHFARSPKKRATTERHLAEAREPRRRVAPVNTPGQSFLGRTEARGKPFVACPFLKPQGTFHSHSPPLTKGAHPLVDFQGGHTQKIFWDTLRSPKNSHPYYQTRNRGRPLERQIQKGKWPSPAKIPSQMPVFQQSGNACTIITTTTTPTAASAENAEYPLHARKTRAPAVEVSHRLGDRLTRTRENRVYTYPFTFPRYRDAIENGVDTEVVVGSGSCPSRLPLADVGTQGGVRGSGRPLQIQSQTVDRYAEGTIKGESRIRENQSLHLHPQMGRDGHSFPEYLLGRTGNSWDALAAIARTRFRSSSFSFGEDSLCQSDWSVDSPVDSFSEPRISTKPDLLPSALLMTLVLCAQITAFLCKSTSYQDGDGRSFRQDEGSERSSSSDKERVPAIDSVCLWMLFGLVFCAGTLVLASGAFSWVLTAVVCVTWFRVLEHEARSRQLLSLD